MRFKLIMRNYCNTIPAKKDASLVKLPVPTKHCLSFTQLDFTKGRIFPTPRNRRSPMEILSFFSDTSNAQNHIHKHNRNSTIVLCLILSR